LKNASKQSENGRTCATFLAQSGLYSLALIQAFDLVLEKCQLLN
jgi:hypothetical protein